MSCDKVEQPVKPTIDIDTTLYTDGNWADYPMPVFTSNQNTNRNVLIEDYTGHKCSACPNAAVIAKDIEDANPTRVFVVSIHTSKGGDGDFQNTGSGCEVPGTDHFCYDFRTNEGNIYGEEFGTGFGFVGNPYGNINRAIIEGADLFLFQTEWQQKTNFVLNENKLSVNLQAESNYYQASNGVYFHVESEFLEDMTGNFNIVTYAIQNEVITWQLMPDLTEDEFYKHHNPFIGCIDDLAWGQSLVTNPVIGDKFQTDYAYELPTGISNTEMHFVTYVYDVDTYEILQVIKHEF
jgi:hypothetical protein